MELMQEDGVITAATNICGLIGLIATLQIDRAVW